MEKLNRRSFFKSSAFALVTLPIFSKALGLLNKAYAFARNDSGIDKQGYIHEVPATGPSDAGSKTKYDGHIQKITDYLVELKKPDAKVSPHCKVCSQFKKDEADGYGECAMVLATGKADGKFVWKDGWCKVWTIAKDKVKKEAGA